MVRATSSDDDNPSGAQLAVASADGIDRGPALLEQTRRHLGLLEDLVVKPAHARNMTSPPTMVRRTCRSASSTTRSAWAPAAMRPNPGSPSTRAGTEDAISIARAALMPGMAAIPRPRPPVTAALP